MLDLARHGWRRLGKRLFEPFPVVAGNRIEGFAKGPDFFTRMTDAIHAATATVDVEMYLWDDDEVGRAFVAALHAAAVRGLNERAYAATEGHIIEGKPDAETTRRLLQSLRDETLLLAGAGELPARNVANLAFLLYSEYLLAVELAGTLLLVATVGAVAIAHRKGAAT